MVRRGSTAHYSGARKSRNGTADFGANQQSERTREFNGDATRQATKERAAWHAAREPVNHGGPEEVMQIRTRRIDPSTLIGGCAPPDRNVAAFARAKDRARP